VYKAGTTTAKKFGIITQRIKEPIAWSQLVDFALLYAFQNKECCHLVIATITFLSFGAMCQYIDISRFIK